MGVGLGVAPNNGAASSRGKLALAKKRSFVMDKTAMRCATNLPTTVGWPVLGAPRW